MSQETLDPDLPGIWIIPGEQTTYEIEADGAYHLADPAQTMTVSDDGTTMIWGTARFDRIGGTDPAPVGAWRDAEHGDEWLFRGDGSYLQKWSDGERTTGIWVLDQRSGALWAREYRGQLDTDGARVTFRLPSGTTVTYGYTVQGNIWTLLDPESWEKLVEYRRPRGEGPAAHTRQGAAG